MRCLLAALVFLGSAHEAGAAGKIESPPGTPPALRGGCDLSGYKPFGLPLPGSVPIPDNDPAGITLGPIPTGPSGAGMLDVNVQVSMSHTWIGDLVIRVVYDASCDGLDTGDEITAGLLCRPGRTCLTGPTDPTFGCGGNVDGPYVFSNSGDASYEGACPALISPGCLAPDSESAPGLTVFTGLNKGGCFYLFVSDNAAADTGEILGVTVYARNDSAVPIEERSWGEIKAAFR